MMLKETDYNNLANPDEIQDEQDSLQNLPNITDNMTSNFPYEHNDAKLIPKETLNIVGINC